MNRLPKKKSAGQTLIEFTLMLPIILIFVGGLTDMGLGLYFGMSLQNAVREGARVAATKPGLGANDSQVAQVVMNRIPGGGVGIYQMSASNVSNTAPTGAGCAVDVMVTGTGTYNYMFLRLFGFTNTQMSRSTKMRYEWSNPVNGTPLCP